MLTKDRRHRFSAAGTDPVLRPRGNLTRVGGVTDEFSSRQHPAHFEPTLQLFIPCTVRIDTPPARPEASCRIHIPRLKTLHQHSSMSKERPSGIETHRQAPESHGRRRGLSAAEPSMAGDCLISIASATVPSLLDGSQPVSNWTFNHRLQLIS